MGLYDTILIKHPLPEGGPADAQERDYQTKDVDSAMDLLELREDGTLWRQEYDTEDHSDAAKWKAEHPGQELPKEMEGILSFAGCMTRVNKRWVQMDFTGEIRFYDCLGARCTGWLEYSAYLLSGKVQQVNLIKYTPPDPVKEEERRKDLEDRLKQMES